MLPLLERVESLAHQKPDERELHLTEDAILVFQTKRRQTGWIKRKVEKIYTFPTTKNNSTTILTLRIIKPQKFLENPRFVQVTACELLRCKL